MQNKMFKFKRVSEDEYIVIHPTAFSKDGIEIGNVWKSWYRNCGEGWTHNLRHSWGFKTRDEACRDLKKCFLKQEGATT